MSLPTTQALGNMLPLQAATPAPGGGGGGGVNSVSGAAPITSTGGANPVIGVTDFTPVDRGTVPASGGGTATFLRADGAWAVPPGTGVISVSGAAPVTSTGGTAPTIGVDDFTPATRGTVPASGGGTTNFLRADGTWAAPPLGTVGVETQYVWNGNGNLTLLSVLSAPGALNGLPVTDPAVVGDGPFDGQRYVAIDSRVTGLVLQMRNPQSAIGRTVSVDWYRIRGGVLDLIGQVQVVQDGTVLPCVAATAAPSGPDDLTSGDQILAAFWTDNATDALDLTATLIHRTFYAAS